MKRNVLFFLMSALLMIGGMNILSGQDQPKPKKDTVNIDTDAKPTFYYAEEDKQNEKESKSGLIIGIVAGVIVLAAAGFFLARKKK